MLSSCIVILSDSGTTFRVFESLSFIICFCFAMGVFFLVFLFDLIYLFVSECGKITRSYLLFRKEQLWVFFSFIA